MIDITEVMKADVDDYRIEEEKRLHNLQGKNFL